MQGVEVTAKKHTYMEMVMIALITLNESGGSTRQELWKCISAKFPESDYKQFILRLKRMQMDTSSFVVQGKTIARFKLEPKFKDKLKRRLDKGLPIIKALSSTAMTDPIKKAMKKPKKVSSAKKGKGKMAKKD